MDAKIKVTNKKYVCIINKTMERVGKEKMKYKEAKFHIGYIGEMIYFLNLIIISQSQFSFVNALH